MSRRNHIRSLTAKELLFVQLYVGNASLAAKQAGYKSPRVVGAKLMRRPEVARAIQQKQELALSESGKTLGRSVDIGRNASVNPNTMLQIIQASRARSGIIEMKVPQILKRDFAPFFMVN